jgi:PBP1b-binding outer membrane lipoprotein LpoB
MKRFIAIFICLIFLVGCSTTAPTMKTEVNVIEPLNDQSHIVIETKGNVTRVYSIKNQEEEN